MEQNQSLTKTQAHEDDLSLGKCAHLWQTWCGPLLLTELATLTAKRTNLKQMYIKRKARKFT